MRLSVRTCQKRRRRQLCFQKRRDPYLFDRSSVRHPRPVSRRGAVDRFCFAQIRPDSQMLRCVFQDPQIQLDEEPHQKAG